MLLQTANESQLCTFVVHSSISKRKKKIAGGKKKTHEAFKTPVAIKVKYTRSMAKTVQLKQTSLTIKLQNSELSLVLLVVETHGI